VEPQDDRYAKRLADLRQELDELDRQEELDELDRQEEQLDREAVGRQVVRRETPVLRRAGRFLSSLLTLVGVLALIAVLAGVAVTLHRLAGRGMGDAPRLGQAAVSSCVRHGPVSTRGFGYWQTCRVEITWADGAVERSTVDELFKSSDIGRAVKVGDPENASTHDPRTLARADVAARPWLKWLSYAVGVVAVVPLFFLGLVFGVIPGPRAKTKRLRRG
jgi:hypothetical protein